MANTWLRLYYETRRDPKVQRLPAQMFKEWINLICYAGEKDGLIPTDLGELCYEFRLPQEKMAATIAFLVSKGLLEKTDGGWKPHNWDGRQYKSDSSTERSKAFRERQRNGQGNVDATLQQHARERNRTEKIKSAGGLGAVDRPAPAPRDPSWNGSAEAMIAHVGQARFDATLAPCPIRMEGEVVVLTARSHVMAIQIDKHCGRALKAEFGDFRVDIQP